MNPTIWVLLILLALAFLAAGLTRLTQPRQKLATTMGLGRGLLRPMGAGHRCPWTSWGLLRPALTVD